MNYYALPYVSNSYLTEVKNTMNLKEMPANIQQIFDSGNLVDGLITQEQKIIHGSREMLTGDARHKVQFTEEEFSKAKKMKLAYHDSPLVQGMFPKPLMQYVYVRKQFRIEFEGDEIFIGAKCMFDLLNRRRLGGDIKTTNAKTQAQFNASIKHFDYDRAGAWYMDLAELDRHIFIGISKHEVRGKHPIFTYPMRRGDENYEIGKMKYSYLAYKNYLLTNFFN